MQNCETFLKGAQTKLSLKHTTSCDKFTWKIPPGTQRTVDITSCDTSSSYEASQVHKVLLWPSRQYISLREINSICYHVQTGKRLP